MSAALSIIALRSAGFVFDQVGNAFSAALMAFKASFLEADEDCQTFSPVPGEVTSNVVDVITSLPLMRSGTV
jgi:hypothetical protein